MSAKAVIVEDGRLLALRLEGRDGDYYILPGGGHDVGETLEERGWSGLLSTESRTGRSTRKRCDRYLPQEPRKREPSTSAT